MTDLRTKWNQSPTDSQTGETCALKGNRRRQATESALFELDEDGLDHLSVDVRQTEVTPLEPGDQLEVIDPKKM